VAILTVAMFYQWNLVEFYQRRLLSFLIFISIFSFCIINPGVKFFNSFLSAICIVSVYLSLTQLSSLLAVGLVGWEILRGVTGTQRFTILYIFAFWIFTYKILVFSVGPIKRILFILMTIIITSGIILSLSRSGYLAFLVSFFAAIFIIKFRSLNKKSINFSSVRGVRVWLIVALGSYFFIPLIYGFYEERIAFMFSWDFFSAALYEPNIETSEGYRLIMWQTIIDFVSRNPVTGSGFLGIWAVTGWNTSAHSEFFDRLLKLGFVGFLMYLYILFSLLRYLIKDFPHLACGFLAALVIGLTHETFSLSYGACILSFLLMLYTSRSRSLKNRLFSY
jgi:O-antigen ligase